GYYDGFWGMEFLRKDRDMTVEKIGIEKGRAEGRAEGEKQKAIDVARKMMSKGLSIDDICDITGLNPEVIENI
ncbi:MAG: hypothetical protein IIT32_02165, partial [Bacteroidales bacterium]|nr:hypothetical protein [Bacteroidales bacterium]